MNDKIAIIGAGISGLSCGYQLNKNNFKNFKIYESSSVCGGAISTYSDSKYLYELGPNTFSVSDKRILEMIDDLKLNSVSPRSSSNARYILRDSKPIRLPTSLFSLMSSNLISLTTKLKIFSEVTNRTKSTKKSESIDDFFERRFNREFVDYFVNPFIAGTFSGDPKKISIKHAFPSIYDMELKYNSVIRGLFKSKKDQNHVKRSIISFKSGLIELIDSLSNLMDDKISLNSKVMSIENSDSKYILSISKHGKIVTEKFNKIIITVPIHKLNDVRFSEKSIVNLKDKISIDYPPLSTVTLSYKKVDIPNPIKGFGLLVPEIEKKSILGVLYLSSMFQYRAPQDEVLITVFIGGSRQPSLARLATEEILDLIKSDLKDIYGIDSHPVYISHKYWPNSIPQYSLSHDHNLNAIEQIESKLKGVVFAGNYIGGISLENNILNAMKSVNKLINYSYE